MAGPYYIKARRSEFLGDVTLIFLLLKQGGDALKLNMSRLAYIYNTIRWDIVSSPAGFSVNKMFSVLCS